MKQQDAKYWLDQGPVTKKETEWAFTYTRKHHLPQTKQARLLAIAKRRKRREVNRYLNSKEEAATDPSAPWQIVYGQTRIGGTLTFIHTSGPADQPNLYLHLVVTLAAHEIYRLTTVYFDNYALSWGTALTGRPTAVVSASGIFSGLVKMQINYGSDSQTALSEAVSDVPSKWTSNHRQRGHAHVYFRLKWSETVFKNGMPDISFVLEGKNDIIDPRSSSASPGAQNAAMILYDYITNSRWGLGASTSELDTTRWQDAVDDCEDLIPLAGGGNEYRYLINTYVSSDQSPGAVIEDMLAAMAGRLTYTEGKFSLYVGKGRTSVLTITDDMILSEIAVLTKIPRLDSFNSVRGTFVSSQNNYEESDFPAVTNSSYVTADNGETVYEDMTWNMTHSAVTAQRLSKIELESVRQGIVAEFTARLDAYKAEPGEWVSVTYSRFGWSAKTFEVVRSAIIIEEDASGMPYFAVRLALREISSAVFDWSTGDETTFDTAPNTNLPNPFTVADPTSLSLASGASHLYLRNDGTVFSRLYASWTAAADAFVVNGGRYELQHKKSADSDWQDSGACPGSSTNFYILDVDDGNSYDVRIRSVSSTGQRGNWVTATGHTVIGKTAAPSDVTGLTGSLQNYGIKLTWNAVSDLDVREYELRVGTTTTAWASATTIGIVRTTTFYYELRTAATYRFQVKALDTTGNYSTNAGTVDVTVANPSTPTFTYVLDGDGFILQWTATSGSYAIREYVIQYGPSFGSGTVIATTTALQHKVLGNWLGDRVFWITAVDVVGNVGSPASVTITVEAPSVPTGFSIFELNGSVLFDWEPSGSSTLPVTRYGIYRGDAFVSATLLGSVDSTFFTFIEPVGGTYTYWLEPVDSAGNVGTALSRTATIGNAPGFVLDYDQDLAASDATLLNATATTDDLGVIGPLDTATTWEDHFLGPGASTIQDLIDDGLVIWGEPTLSTRPGKATWTVDLGTEYKAAGITLAYTAEEVAAPSVVVPHLAYRKDDSFRWTKATPGLTQVRGTEYRYVRVGVDLGGTFLDPATATLSNAVDMGDDETLTFPLNASQTWEGHFTGFGYTTIQNFIDAGYTKWLQPAGVGTSTAVWEFDCGTTAAAGTDIDATSSITQADGTHTVAVSAILSVRRDQTSNWTEVTNGLLTLGGDGFYHLTGTSASAFRYVRYELYGTRTGIAIKASAEVTAAIRVGDNTSLALARDVNVRISTTRRQDSGSWYARAVDTDGSFVPYNLVFKDIESVTVSPATTAEQKAVPNWIDLVDPTGFYVFLFDATGARIDGWVSWSATGIVEA